MRQFNELGVSTVLDLRDDSERTYAPSVLPENVQIIPSPIMQSIGNTLNDADVSIHSFYQNLVDTYATNYVRGIRHLINNADGPVLVHCTAGKDRTGTFIALVLLAMDVDREDVLNDYAQTEEYLAGEWANQHIAFMRASGLEITANLHTLLVQSPSDALDSALTRIEQRYGSVPDYLRTHGLSDAEMQSLGELLLELPESSNQ